MNKEELKGNWNVLKGRVKQQWGELTDDDVTKLDGDYDELCGLLQIRLGKTQEQAHAEVDRFLGTD